jgi:hypothetical protein
MPPVARHGKKRLPVAMRSCTAQPLMDERDAKPASTLSIAGRKPNGLCCGGNGLSSSVDPLP